MAPLHTRGLLSSPGGGAPSAGCLCPGLAQCLVYSPVLCGSSLIAQPPGAGTLEPANVSLCCWLPLLPPAISAKAIYTESLHPCLPHSFSLILPIFLPAFPPFPLSSLSSSQSPFFLSLLHPPRLPHFLLFHFPPSLLSHSPPSPPTLPLPLSFFQFMLFLVPFSLSFTLFSLPPFIS